jgi:putative transposase
MFLRFTDEQRRRLAVKGHALGRKALRELGPIVTPDTILRWYRELIAEKYDGSEQRKMGRPRTPDELQDLVTRMAQENPGWGYTRIRDALGNLGYELARTTIRSILKEHGIEPAPERSKRTTWKAFLRAHWPAIAACDFFTVEALTWSGLTRFYVMVVIALQTRRVEIAGIIRQPHGAWMLQVARNLLDADDGFLAGKRYLLMDRDPLYTIAFRELLRSAGVTPIRLPPSQPQLERLRRALRPLHQERVPRQARAAGREPSPHSRPRIRRPLPHRAQPPSRRGAAHRAANQCRWAGPIVCRERIGGLLRFYYRQAA